MFPFVFAFSHPSRRWRRGGASTLGRPARSGCRSAPGHDTSPVRRRRPESFLDVPLRLGKFPIKPDHLTELIYTLEWFCSQSCGHSPQRECFPSFSVTAASPAAFFELQRVHHTSYQHLHCKVPCIAWAPNASNQLLSRRTLHVHSANDALHAPTCHSSPRAAATDAARPAATARRHH